MDLAMIPKGHAIGVVAADSYDGTAEPRGSLVRWPARTT
jgi:hypothetical protein